MVGEWLSGALMCINSAARAGAVLCLAVWSAPCFRGYPNNDPPADKNDEAAVAAVTGIYKTGLGNLKAVLEKR